MTKLEVYKKSVCSPSERDVVQRPKRPFPAKGGEHANLYAAKSQLTRLSQPADTVCVCVCVRAHQQHAKGVAGLALRQHRSARARECLVFP